MTETINWQQVEVGRKCKMNKVFLSPAFFLINVNLFNTVNNWPFSLEGNSKRIIGSVFVCISLASCPVSRGHLQSSYFSLTYFQLSSGKW